MNERTKTLIEILKHNAESVPLPETMSIRNIETHQGDNWFQILINCYSPRCKSDGSRRLSVFSEVFAAVHDHLIDPDIMKSHGWVCQDSEVLPDFGQSDFHCAGTRFWFQFYPIK